MFGKKMVEGKARILAFEGLTSGSSNTPKLMRAADQARRSEP